MSTHSDTDPITAQAISGALTEPVETLTPSNGEEAGEGTDVATKAQPLFGGLSAAEAGRRSAQRRAERALAGETEVAHARRDETLVIRCSVETGAVIDKLAKDAKAGNVQAARELRAWLDKLPVEADTDLSALDKRTRQRVLAWCIAEIEREHRESSAESIETDPPSSQPGEGETAGG